MSNKQVRIFVPATEPWWWWAETLLGRVVKPLIEKYRSDIPYFWFSRYGNILTEDIGDCDFDKISDACKAPISPGEIVVEALHARYTEETGKPIPDGWE